jgi:predicted RND superfamily exporter protein
MLYCGLLEVLIISSPSALIDLKGKNDTWMILVLGRPGMVYNHSMSGFRSRTAMLTAVLFALLFIALLAWRGLKASTAADLPPTLAWREVGEDELF